MANRTLPPARSFARYERDPVAFIDERVKVNELGQPWRLLDHQREILAAAFDFGDDGRLAWDTFVFACPKKTGKTTINGALATWWAFTQEAPNEIYVLANDLEQAQARAFATMGRLISRNPKLGGVVETKRILLANGTEVKAVASEYAGAAGSNHGLTCWDELWGYVSEGSRRLWEEMTPVPTRRNSIRIITTYAGFEGESALLRELYLAGVGPEEHPDGKAERIHETLPLYLNRQARLLVYWDHEPRMPWQTSAYYATQKATLRPNAYLRLHENRWTSGESAFITPELWDANTDAGHRPALPNRAATPLFVGVDAGIKHDNAAVVAVRWGAGRLELATHKIWRPTPQDPLDLEATVEAFLRELRRQYRVARILADPYQLHRSISTLKAAGLPIEEYAQTTQGTTAMGEALFGLLNGRNLRLYPADDLRQQALNAVAVESTRGWRIAKEKAAKKIDAIVALAMACVGAIEEGPSKPSAAVVTSFTRSFGTMDTSREVRATTQPTAAHAECAGRCGINVLIQHDQAWRDCPYVPKAVRLERTDTSCTLPGCPHASHSTRLAQDLRARMSAADQSMIHPHERIENPGPTEMSERKRRAWAGV
jgi:phage terminase large subunit-like protein